jgi:hypothetical protein
MGSLTDRGYPYPELPDATAVPLHIKALAESVDADMTEVIDENLADRAFRRVTRDPANTVNVGVTPVGVAAWGFSNYDNGGGITAGTGGDSGKLITPAGQIGSKGYAWSAEVEIPVGTGQAQAWVQVNGTDFGAGRTSLVLSAAHLNWLPAYGTLVLDPGDKVQLMLAYPDGGTLAFSPLVFALECKG